MRYESNYKKVYIMNESKTKAIINIVVALILALSVIISYFIGVKAMVAISSKPLEVYDAIFDSLQQMIHTVLMG